MQMQGTDLDEAKNSDTQLLGNGKFQEFWQRLIKAQLLLSLAWGLFTLQWLHSGHCYPESDMF